MVVRTLRTGFRPLISQATHPIGLVWLFFWCPCISFKLTGGYVRTRPTAPLVIRFSIHSLLIQPYQSARPQTHYEGCEKHDSAESTPSALSSTHPQHPSPAPPLRLQVLNPETRRAAHTPQVDRTI
ncbi:hypothetical protein Cob_v000328 [Colletotrichum orbiculare MAFF 240422]|uniref:Uncharacterized protein n=1 Tax=Colletotrichum orbiculare (strain 104-T / ATCC 96160 / CBS 514.97 / LARS 414 / MAFF 240422) TaxID=1213857 RepID=A0A484G889_COLOR|nr:hypothetical protein Cob_v000328 [Colletotrichum orbiculare MAFF 240422]